MGRFFNYDNGIMSALAKLADCMILAFLWAGCSIPIFTIGASTTALYYAVNKSVRHNRGYAWKEFLTAFKSNFKQSTVVWLMILALYILGAVDCYILSMMGEAISFSNILMGIIIALMILVTMWVIYLFPYMARFESERKVVMKNSALIAIANIFWTILLLVIFVVAVVLFLLLPMIGLFIPVIYMVLANLILERIFRKYMSVEDLREEAERDQVYYKELKAYENAEEKEKMEEIEE